MGCCQKKRKNDNNIKEEDIEKKINNDESQKGLFGSDKIFINDNKKENLLMFKKNKNSKKDDGGDKYYNILIGLNNIGATCYMNSTLQCLSNTKKLTEYFFTKFKFNKDDNTKKISNEFYNLLKSLWNVKNTKNKPYSPESFKKAISEENELFKGIQANDSRDLINFLLEQIHTELNIQNNNQNQNNILGSNPHIQTNQKEMFNIFLTDFKNNYKSIISDLFYGIYETIFTCNNYRKIKYSYGIFTFLEFPLQQVNLYLGRGFSNNNKNPDINLLECFKYYKKQEMMTGENKMFCNECQTSSDAFYSSSLFSMPMYLIIILNRGRGNIYKCNVNFEEIINLSNYVTFKNGGYMYDLYAVICHLGESSMNGHFIAFCRHRVSDKWYKYNDSIVTECGNKEYLLGEPYILFYQQIES